MDNIYLIGFMGAGKTTVGKSLTKRTGWDFVDTDEEIIRRCGRSIPEIFEQDGEEYFRSCETKVMEDLADRERCIVSCGGGVAMREENVRAMKKGGTVVLIEASPKIIIERVRRSDSRPLVRGKSDEEIKALMDARDEYYSKAADIRVRSDDRSEIAVAARIERLTIKKG